MNREERSNLALVIHNHQPVGNRDDIIERVYRTSYLPFLKVLDAHAGIIVNLHYTGFLLEWISERHPEFIELLQKIVDRGQAELIGGAYYEPVISVIPDVDALGQTQMLSERVKAMFGRQPRGFWTAERAWEPHLPEILSSAGAEFTFIDDISFESAGLDESQLFEPYLVESRGKFVTVFPIQKELRYFIPFKPVARTLSYLAQVRKNGLAVYGDDGEKFGAWPSTYDRVYKEGWLDTFFREISKRRWIRTVKVSEYLSDNPTSKRIYLPASAYSEMMDWAVPVSSRKKSPRTGEKIDGIPHRGFWRLFLAKYPESARIYSKMVGLSEEIHALETKEIGKALVELWKGQCNDAYWHGIFGGLYAPILRRITYSNLIRAQVERETSLSGKENAWISVDGNNRMGYPEFEVNSQDLGLVVSPTKGGAICEIDYKPLFVNLADMLTRRPERYHADVKRHSRKTIVPQEKNERTVSMHEVAKSGVPGLEKLLIYDRYPKYSFVDYLVPCETTIDSFERQDFQEVAKFPSSKYEAEILKSDATVTLIQSSQIAEAESGSLIMKKNLVISPKRAGFRVDYELRASGGLKNQILLVPEINFGCLSDKSFAKSHRNSAIVKSDSITVAHNEIGVRSNVISKNVEAYWMIPVRTVSMSEEGFESNLQGLSILPICKIDSGITNFSTSFELEFLSS